MKEAVTTGPEKGGKVLDNITEVKSTRTVPLCLDVGSE